MDAPSHITINPEGPPLAGTIVVEAADGTIQYHDTTAPQDTTPVRVRFRVTHADDGGLHAPGDEHTVTRHVADQLVWLNIAEEVA